MARVYIGIEELKLLRYPDEYGSYPTVRYRYRTVVYRAYGTAATIRYHISRYRHGIDRYTHIGRYR